MNWKKIRVLISIGLLFVTMTICFYLQDQDAVNTVRFIAQADDQVTQTVRLYYDDGTYYAFLPSFADNDSLRIVYDNDYSLFLDDKYFDSESSFSSFQTNKEYELKIKNSLHFTVCNEKLIIMKAEHIPALSIHLTDGKIENINADKNISKSGIATLITEDKTVDYSGEIKAIHGRGNSTWDQAKKSYSLDLPVETELLGMGAGKDWVLLSNSFDESGLRNKLAYDTAKAIGVKFPVDSEYVDLYIDNVYYGMYLLSQKIYVGANHVDINNLEEKTKSLNQYPLSFYNHFEEKRNGKILKGYDIPKNPQDITGGYLVQIEHHEEKLDSRESLFQTDSLGFSLSSPKHASRQQISYLSDYFNTVEVHLAEGDLSDIDVDSFARYYLIQELFANRDKNSVFFYKDSDMIDGKVYACSIWDLDLSMGNGWLVSNVNPSVLYRNTNNWFDYLYDNPTFQASLAEQYANVIRPHVGKLIYKRLKEYKKLTESSFAMDKVRWQYAIRGFSVSDADRTDSSQWGNLSQHHFDTLDEHVTYITDFMKKRIQFLDSTWIDGVTYCFVSFSTPKNSEYYTIKKGDVLTEVPDSPSDGEYGRFIGWFDDDGNEYMPHQTVTQSINYNARWEQTGGTASKLASLRAIIDRIKANPAHESIYLAGGLVIIIGAIVCFVTTDIRKAKKRRAGNGQ